MELAVSTVFRERVESNYKNVYWLSLLLPSCVELLMFEDNVPFLHEVRDKFCFYGSYFARSSSPHVKRVQKLSALLPIKYTVEPLCRGRHWDLSVCPL